MTPLQWLRDLYSLDTLDTRFTIGSTTPPRAARDDAANGKSVGEQRAPGSKPSKWNTWEYYFYYLVISIAVPLMLYVPYRVSKGDSQYHKFDPLLSPGWIFGRKVYASFRGNLPYVAVLVLVHPLLRRLYELARPLPKSPNSKPEAAGDLRLARRITFDLAFASIFLVALHGASALKVLAILSANYAIGKHTPRSYIPALTWTFNIGILFANELCHGYRFRDIARNFGLPSSIAQLDAFGGLIPRWEVLFNITVLRLVSFNLDYYWSLDQRAASPVEKKQTSPADLSDRDRVANPAPLRTYDFRHYVAYILYSPLYLAGPILTFNDFISQLRFPPLTITRKRTAMYAVRFLFTLLTMEVLLHYIYAVAISKSDPDWSHYSPFELSMLGFFNLHIIWLKLLLPWRLFRLWALLDGVDPPENMVRCMSDNYSALAFWRGWHRSYNRWIVRYIYVPLGGSGRGTSKARSVANLLLVFTFVALWHDISLTLLTWSWLIVLFIVPELLCTTVFFPARKYKDRPDTYRYLSGIGAVANIFMMMAANLVGFALGLDGLKGLVGGIFSGVGGIAFLVTAAGVLFTGSMVMFEKREAERRDGFFMKC